MLAVASLYADASSSSLQNEQIKTVEETKLTSRKRGGVVHFVKYFPVYVGRVEALMIGTEGLEIREGVDVAYDRIVTAMFESLKRMAKMEGEEEDKGQLNYHVILIGAAVVSCPFFSVLWVTDTRRFREHALLCDGDSELGHRICLVVFGSGRERV